MKRWIYFPIQFLMIFRVLLFSSETSLIQERELLKKAFFYEGEKNLAKAGEYFKLLEKKFPNEKTYLELGHFYARQKKFKIAVPYFYKTVSNLALDYPNLEDIFYKYQLYDELLKLYLKGEKDIDDVYLKRYFAQEAVKMFKLLSNYDGAIKYILDKVKKSNKVNHYYFKQLLDIAIQEEHHKQVIFQLNRLGQEKIKPRHHFFIFDLKAGIYYSLKDYKQSTEFYRKAIALDFFKKYEVEDILRKFDIHYRYGDTLKLIDRYIKVLQKRMKFQKDNRRYLKVLLRKGYLHQLLDEVQQGEAVFKEVLENANPKKRGHLYLINESYYNLGRIYFFKNEYGKAKKMFLRVKRKYNRRTQIFITRCYMAQGNYDKALNLLLITGENSQSVYYKALISLFRSNINDSIEQLEKVVLKYGQTRLATKALQKLEMLYRIKGNKRKIDKFILFEKLWENRNFKLLLNKQKEILSLYSDDEDQKSYYLLYYSEIYIRQKAFDKAESVLLKINNNSKHPFWIQKSSFLLAKLYIKKMDKKEAGIKLLRDLVKKYPRTLFLLPAKELIKNHSKLKKTNKMAK